MLKSTVDRKKLKLMECEDKIDANENIMEEGLTFAASGSLLSSFNSIQLSHHNFKVYRCNSTDSSDDYYACHNR